MRCNTDCTVYLVNGRDFTRHYIEQAHWEDKRGINFNKAGSTDVDSVSVWIPLGEAELPTFREGKRNYLVRGNIDFELTEATEKTFLGSVDALTITSIAKNDFGSPAMQHWVVYAK